MSATAPETVPLRLRRRTVVIGGFTGMVVAGALFWVVYRATNQVASAAAASVLERLVLAIRCDAVAALMLLAGIHWVAGVRGVTEAIDPMAGAESRSLRIDINYVNNTVEQLLLFVIGTLALATLITPAQAAVLPAATVVFVLGRVVFWAGYHIHPLWRAPGMAATGIVNAVMLVYITIRLVGLALS